jgi:hypothetical protein
MSNRKVFLYITIGVNNKLGKFVMEFDNYIVLTIIKNFKIMFNGENGI